MQDALLDACVLYPAPLRDFFMRLAIKLYQPKWTDAIHEEWIRSVLKDRPDLTLTQLTRTRELMNRHGGTCLVTGYEALIPTLSLPDPNDRHVLAAAITARAPIIVTFNLSDFPAQTLSLHKTRAVHPDDFAVSLYQSDPEQFIHLVKLHRQALANPPKHDCICLEDLAVSALAKTKLRGHSKSWHDASWGTFRRQLTYKARWRGQRLVAIGRWYPSSQECHGCGLRTKHDLSVRTWECAGCGTTHDRDINAARVILAEGLRLLACGNQDNSTSVERLSDSRNGSRLRRSRNLLKAI